MIWFTCLIISFLLGFILADAVNQKTIKSYRSLDESREDYIKTLEESNSYWEEQSNYWASKYFEHRKSK